MRNARCRIGALWALMGLLPAVAAAQDAVSPATTWYAQALTRGEGGLNVTHFWSKGPWMRSETVVAGHRVVTIVRDEWYYAFDGTDLAGIAIQRDPDTVARDQPDKRPFGDEYRMLLSQGAEQVREEEVMGLPTGVFRVTDHRGRREAWITLDEHRLPLRVEMFERRTAERRYTDYVNWQRDLPIADEFFQPDPRIEFDQMELAQYLKRSGARGPIGPIPVLFSDLLYRKKEE